MGKKIKSIIFFISFFLQILKGENVNFESIWKAEKEFKLPSMGEISFDLPWIPKRNNYTTVLKLNCSLNYQGPGSNYYLQIEINDRPVYKYVGNKSFGYPRVLYTSSGKYNLEFLKENRILIFWPNFTEYFLDISDFFVTAEEGYCVKNKIKLKNLAKPEYFGLSADKDISIIVKDLEVGYIPTKIAEMSPLRKDLITKIEGKPILDYKNKGFSLSIFQGGGFLINIGEDKYLVESKFSYPYMKEGKWNRFSISDVKGEDEWGIKIEKIRDGLRIKGEGKFYSIVREIVDKKTHLLIKDTFSNKYSDDIGVVFENRVTPIDIPEKICLAGEYKKTYFPYSPPNVSKNPTIFIGGKNKGLGMVALDDFYVLQLSLKQEGKSVYFLNQNFGLPSGDSYTFEWALYPVNTNDYYDFINLVRKDYIPSYKIEGSGAFMFYNMPIIWSKEEKKKWLEQRNAKIVILSGPYSGAPWLGGYCSLHYKLPPYNEGEHLKSLKEAVKKLKEIDPEIKCLAPVETFFACMEAKPGETTPRFLDSAIVLENGCYMVYGAPREKGKLEKFLNEEPHSFMYYPTLTNSYYKWLKELIEKALKEAELDGIYFDIFSPTDFTYNTWDGKSVDIDMATYTIKKKKANIEKISEDARSELVKMILNYKKGNVVVANTVPSVSKIKGLPIFHFEEDIEDYAYCQLHLSPTPICLGWTPGYKPGAESINKEGEWWKTWNKDKDYFEDIKEKLRYGCLYYTYWAPSSPWDNKLTRKTILSYMYPITVEEIHSGWIKGKERIITLKSGYYGIGANEAKIYLFNEKGELIKEEITKFKNTIYLNIPEGGAGVLEKIK
jgi:hypothetical protein